MTFNDPIREQRRNEIFELLTSYEEDYDDCLVVFHLADGVGTNSAEQSWIVSEMEDDHFQAIIVTLEMVSDHRYNKLTQN